MKYILLLLITLVLSSGSLWAQNQASTGPVYEVATTWPGVHYQIFHVERIAGNRLLIGVKIFATAQAPQRGTLIGESVPIPAHPDPILLASGTYRPTPFYINSAIMTDETTKQTFPTLKPDPNGPNYIPGFLLATIHPNEGQIMSIQFPVPPPPEGQTAAQYNPTISIFLPRAIAPITGIALPPPVPTPAAP